MILEQEVGEVNDSIKDAGEVSAVPRIGLSSSTETHPIYKHGGTVLDRSCPLDWI